MPAEDATRTPKWSEAEPDAGTVKVTLTQSNSAFLAQVNASYLGIVNSKAVSAEGGSDAAGADKMAEITIPQVWEALNNPTEQLIVNTDLAPNVTSICDLFDPQYKGKVTMLTELRDSVPMTLKCMGIDPDKATEAQWLSRSYVE